MKKFLKVIAVSLALVSILCVSAFAATPQEDVLAAIKASVPEDLYNAHKVEVENLAKQVPVDANQAAEIIALIEEVTGRIDLTNVNHLADLTPEEREFVLEKLDAACALVNVTYTISASKDPDVRSDMVITFSYNGQVIGALDSHDVKKTGETDYPAATALMIGGAVLALAAVAFIGTKKFVLSK